VTAAFGLEPLKKITGGNAKSPGGNGVSPAAASLACQGSQGKVGGVTENDPSIFADIDVTPSGRLRASFKEDRA